MKNWFLSLSKQYKIIAVFVVLVFGLILYFGIRTAYYKNQLYKERAKQIEALQVEKEGLSQRVELLEIENDFLENAKQTVIYKTVEIETKLKHAKDETNNVPGSVGLFSDRELDSTIRTHKHFKRAKD